MLDDLCERCAQMVFVFWTTFVLFTKFCQRDHGREGELDEASSVLVGGEEVLTEFCPKVG